MSIPPRVVTLLIPFVILALASIHSIDLLRAEIKAVNTELLDVSRSVFANPQLSDTGNLEEGFSSAGTRVACIEGFGPAEGLAQSLAGQNHLEELSLICICLSDTEVQAITQLPRLSRLDLRGCQLTGAQLVRLCTMKSLTKVDLRGAIVPVESLREAQRLSPLLTVQCDLR